MITIPDVGEVFCGQAGTTSGGSTFTNKSSATAIANATHLTATQNSNGTYNLAPAKATST